MLQPTPTSPAAAYALALLGDVHVALGQAPLARLAYEQAVRTAAANGHAQALQLAVAGLTMVLAEGGDVTSAQDVLTFGRCYHGQMAQVQLELAEAAVAAVADPAQGSAAALRAAQTARRRHDRHGLARALEIARRTRDRQGAPKPHRAGEAHRATRPRLAGVEPSAATAGAGAAAGDGSARPVVVRCLGVFAVTVAGLPVEGRRWGSRKPRDLLKILAVAHGQPVPREVAAQRLWPDVPPAAAMSRLAVALSTLRRILDHGRAGAAALVVDRNTLRLDPAAVDVDLERFLTLARRVGHADELALAEECWSGELLPDDLDEDWTAAPRDEAREAYGTVLRALATHATERGDHDGTVRRCLRLLELDPVDEDAHLALVRALAVARRHGEARRRHDIYVARMGELGLAALPLASVLAAGRREVS
jgi:DNA-binding SARP family transcriptional activator